jgi:hypothetical protein
LVQNPKTFGLVDTVFDGLVAWKIHNTHQPRDTTKKDTVKTVLALINELQIQDSTGFDEEIDISSSSKAAMVCKLAQVP